MVLKLHGFPSSPCTLRVATALHEKKLPFEFVNVSLFTGEHKQPEYLKIQPFGQIPYLEDDDFIVYESRAIGKYLEAKYPSLAPAKSDLRAYGLYEQALSIEAANFDHFATIALAEKMFKPMKGLETNETAAKDALAALDGKLDAYNVILGKQKYLAGDKLTLADLFHLPEGTLLGQIGYEGLTASSRPNVARWWNEIQGRESWVGLKDGVKSVSA
ncbi:glutathione S-transferase-like protein [Peniophora sp. CONT]|nr:glutathione S-transferase-like protein [Peniophora sp. CONT]